MYWALRCGEHNRLERTAQTRAEVGEGGGGEEAEELGPLRSAAGWVGGHPPPAAGMTLEVQVGVTEQCAAAQKANKSGAQAG